MRYLSLPAMRLTFLLLLCFQFAQAQTLYKNYTIKVGGVTVGELKALKSVNSAGEILFEIKSHVDVNFVVYKLLMDYNLKSNFVNGKMKDAKVSVVSNKGEFYGVTVPKGKGYHAKVKQHKKEFEKTFTEAFLATSSSLYFTEPKNVSHYYAEFNGELMKLSKVKTGVYKGTSDENEDTFYYENGNLVKAVKKHAFKDFEFIYKSGGTL